MRSFATAIVTAVAGVVGLCAGCGGDTAGRQAISGMVNVDGAPVEKGNISFQPVDKGLPGGGKISGGKYSIARKDGVPAGKYRVTINAPVPATGSVPPAGAMPGEALPPPQELIPPEWNTNSEQFVEITAKGKNEFNFDVKAKKK
jgi:hypothetical protein